MFRIVNMDDFCLWMRFWKDTFNSKLLKGHYIYHTGLKSSWFWASDSIICKAILQTCWTDPQQVTTVRQAWYCHMSYQFGAIIDTSCPYSQTDSTASIPQQSSFQHESAQGVCWHHWKAMLISTCHSVTWQIQAVRVVSQLALAMAAPSLWPLLRQVGAAVGEFSNCIVLHERKTWD